MPSSSLVVFWRAVFPAHAVTACPSVSAKQAARPSSSVSTTATISLPAPSSMPRKTPWRNYLPVHRPLHTLEPSLTHACSPCLASTSHPLKGRPLAIRIKRLANLRLGPLGTRDSQAAPEASPAEQKACVPTDEMHARDYSPRRRQPRQFCSNARPIERGTPPETRKGRGRPDPEQGSQ